MTDYSKYTFCTKELVTVVLKSFAAVAVLGYLFFGEIIYGAIGFIPFLFFSIRREKRNGMEKRDMKLKEEFRDALCSLASGLEAGYSVEGALAEAEKDMRLMHGEGALIVSELKYIIRRIQNGGSIEEGFNDFADRSGNEDAKNFSEVFSIAKRSGGELLRVINSITGVMQEKLEAKKEIDLLIASKKYETGIMKFMPPAIIAYLRFTSPDFIGPLYQGSGRLFMLAVVMVWLLLIYISEKVMNINV